MRDGQPELYQYALSPRRVWLVRWLSLLGLGATVLSIVGYVIAVYLHGWLVLVSLPALLVILVFQGLRYLLQSRYPQFDAQAHEDHVAAYWKRTRPDTAPSVAVFLPVAGEPLAVVEQTLSAIMRLDYPRLQIYVLDDTKTAPYKTLAQQLGADYINRPNSGEHKKSGNLNYALKHTPWSDHVLVLDADFAPRADMLQHMVPYTGPSISLVQTPQHFPLSERLFATSKVAYGAGYLQRGFYKYIEATAAQYNAAICLGTNALYNRQALASIDGFCINDHGEDIETGLTTLNHNSPARAPYHTKYLPIHLASGACPETYFSYFKQQSRWATGGYRLAFHPVMLRSRSLRPLQKAASLTYSLSYLYPIWWLVLPLQLLALALANTQVSAWLLLFFVPLAAVAVLLQLLIWQRHHISATLVTNLAGAYIYLQALWLWLRGRPLGWEATGAITDSKHARLVQLQWVMVLYAGLVCGGTIVLALFNHANWYGAVIALTMLPFAVLQAMHLAYVIRSR